jgi:hypothetical protein
LSAELLDAVVFIEVAVVDTPPERLTRKRGACEDWVETEFAPNRGWFFAKPQLRNPAGSIRAGRQPRQKLGTRSAYVDLPAGSESINFTQSKHPHDHAS